MPLKNYGFLWKPCSLQSRQRQSFQVGSTHSIVDLAAHFPIPQDTVPTAGSASSDLQGYAVHNACAELNKRLQPYREKLGDDASMADLAAVAWRDRISLSVTGFFKAPGLGYEWK